MSLKLSSLGFLMLGCLLSAQAQDCTPDQTITQNGFYPKTIDDALVGKAYKQVLQIRVFKDTVVVIAGNPTLATIDSINVDDILGLPNGFYYTCSRKNCSYIPDSTGCATLKGNPKASDVGTYPLFIAIEVYGKIFGSIKTTQKDTLDQFTINVVDESSVDLVLYPRTEVAYPNPSQNGSFSINRLFIDQLSDIKVFNALGQKVPVFTSPGGFTLPAEPGFYFVHYTFSNGQLGKETLMITR